MDLKSCVNLFKLCTTFQSMCIFLVRGSIASVRFFQKGLKKKESTNHFNGRISDVHHNLVKDVFGVKAVFCTLLKSYTFKLFWLQKVIKRSTPRLSRIYHTSSAKTLLPKEISLAIITKPIPLAWVEGCRDSSLWDVSRLETNAFPPRQRVQRPWQRLLCLCCSICILDPSESEANFRGQTRALGNSASKSLSQPLPKTGQTVWRPLFLCL